MGLDLYRLRALRAITRSAWKCFAGVVCICVCVCLSVPVSVSCVCLCVCICIWVCVFVCDFAENVSFGCVAPLIFLRPPSDA